MISHLKVLVIDDELTILDVLETYLRERGYTVEARTNGEEGLAVLRDHDFDLVISDINMVGMNGFEFLRIARANYPELGIILMTAYEEEHPLSEALRAGADGYISKPFTLKKFSLIFDQAYWNAVQREDWWASHSDSSASNGG